MRLYFVIGLLVELKSAFWILMLPYRLHFVSVRSDEWFVCNFHQT